MSDQCPELFVAGLIDASSLKVGDIVAVTGDNVTLHDQTSTIVAAYTIPFGKSGKYLIAARGGFTYAAGGYRGMAIKINGSFVDSPVYCGGYTTIAPVNPPVILSGSFLRYLFAGDLVELTEIQNSGGDLTTGTGQTRLELIRLGG